MLEATSSLRTGFSESTSSSTAAPHVAALQLAGAGEIFGRRAALMPRRDETVQRPPAVPAREELVREGRADEAGAARDQDGLAHDALARGGDESRVAEPGRGAQ